MCPQDMLYVWTEPKLCMGGVSLPGKRRLQCENMDFFIRLSASLGALTAVLLVILTCYFWKKNKRSQLSPYTERMHQRFPFIHISRCMRRNGGFRGDSDFIKDWMAL